MTRQYNHLSKSERKVADYIFKHNDIMQSMKISEVALACGVSSSTVTRFCYALGLKSFSDFKWSLSQSLAKSTGAAVENEPPDDDEANIHEKVKASDSIPVKCKKLCHTGMQALAQTIKHMDYDAVDKAVDLLCKAKNVYCFGQGNSANIASDAWGRFTCVTPKFHWISDVHMQLYTASLLGEEDVVLYFSFSGTTQELIEAGKLLSGTKAKLLLVTHFPNSEGAKYADIVLICGVMEPSRYQGSIAAKIGQLLIVDILFNEYCARNLEQIVENNNKTLNAVARSRF